ncbi:hypothetical protein [Streptomyces sp. NBC_00827]|uniref:hypothetical protein n=1 Tax=Streptomyces sp. NBC_00827 TaxID=2903677 RepID=UPI0038674746|nr:hypothetical protein OG569_16665 [Streptomyces sp. NBC_00827]
MTTAQWVSAAATTAGTFTALFIAVRQNSAAQRVLRGAQIERATLTAITEVGDDSVTIHNHGQTPIFRLRIWKVESLLFEMDEVDGVPVQINAGEVSARIASRTERVVGPGSSATFSFSWAAADGSPLPGQGEQLELPPGEVCFRFTDAAGTTWQRKNDLLPEPLGGTPLPGTVRTHHRVGLWTRSSARTAKRNLRLGFDGKGFTKKSRARKRKKRADRRRAERELSRGTQSD